MIRIFSHYLHRNCIERALVDTIAVMASVFAVTFVYAGATKEAVPGAGSSGLSVAAGMFLANAATGFYGSRLKSSWAGAFGRAAVALALALPVTYLILLFKPSVAGHQNPIQIAAMIGVAAVILHRGYEMASSSVRAGRRTRVLILGCGEAARVVGQTLASADPNVQIVGYLPGPNERDPAVPLNELLPAEQSLTLTAKRLQVDEIVVALTERRAGSMPLHELLDCKLQGVKVNDINSHFERRLGQIRIDYVYAGWLIFGDGFNQAFARTFVKRVFDVFCGTLLIIFSAPLMLLAALAIRLDSRGPVLYRQERVGMNGKGFVVIKFRSMRTDSEIDGRPRWATANDDRVTRVGRFIRKTRIDELPQLFSVLKGDMSLVGPRPERAFFVDELTRRIPFYSVRHSVKPGVTGWAQVRYQYGSTVEDSQEKLQYDLYYVKNHTLFLDLLILLATVRVVLTGQGAR